MDSHHTHYVKTRRDKRSTIQRWPRSDPARLVDVNFFLTLVCAPKHLIFLTSNSRAAHQQFGRHSPPHSYKKHIPIFCSKTLINNNKKYAKLIKKNKWMLFQIGRYITHTHSHTQEKAKTYSYIPGQERKIMSGTTLQAIIFI